MELEVKPHFPFSGLSYTTDNDLSGAVVFCFLLDSSMDVCPSDTVTWIKTAGVIFPILQTGNLRLRYITSLCKAPRHLLSGDGT